MEHRIIWRNISMLTKFDPKLPHNLLPKLPPSYELESRKVLKLCIEARGALANLNTSGSLIPNQLILINSLPLLEAKASSEIENIVTTTDRLFQFVNTGDNTADSATKEALRYRGALHTGYLSLGERPLCTSTAIKVCSEIKGVEMEIRRVPGTALKNGASGEVIYTPPVGESSLRDLLSNWEKFMNENLELDPLVRMAVGHYQFEAIHPFTDGNGRTGRILNLLYLIQQDLISLPILYLSRYIIRNKSDYYRLLQNVTVHGEWEPWILYMLDAVRETSNWTTHKIKSIRLAVEDTAEIVKRDRSSIYKRELIDVIFTQPYCRIGNLVEEKIATRQTASYYLKELADIGILKEIKVGREKIFINVQLMNVLLDDSDSSEQ